MSRVHQPLGLLCLCAAAAASGPAGAKQMRAGKSTPPFQTSSEVRAVEDGFAIVTQVRLPSTEPQPVLVPLGGSVRIDRTILAFPNPSSRSIQP